MCIRDRYYLLLFATPFHSDPRLGKVLFNAGVMIVTPVKLLGLLTVAAAFLSPQPELSAPHLRNTPLLLFVPFAILPVVTVFVFDLPTPAGQISQLLSAALLFAATRPLIRTKERMFKVARTLVVAFAFSSLWVYKEYFIEHGGRAWGLEGESNYEALMLLLSLPIGFWMWSYEQSSWWRRIGLGCGLLLVGAVILTESRAGIIAAGAMGLVRVTRSRHKLFGAAFLVAATLLMFNYGPAGLSQRFRSIKFSGEAVNGDEGSTRIHIELLKAGLHMMESHPALGVGMGQFQTVAPEYNPEILMVANHSWIAHNTFIQTGAECGVPVLLLFVAMLGVAVRNFRIGQRSSDAALGALGFAMEVGILGISVAGAAISVEFLPFCIFIFLSQSLREIAVAEASPAACAPQAERFDRASYRRA